MNIPTGGGRGEADWGRSRKRNRMGSINLRERRTGVKVFEAALESCHYRGGRGVQKK